MVGWVNHPEDAIPHVAPHELSAKGSEAKHHDPLPPAVKASWDKALASVPFDTVIRHEGLSPNRPSASLHTSRNDTSRSLLHLFSASTLLVSSIRRAQTVIRSGNNDVMLKTSLVVMRSSNAPEK